MERALARGGGRTPSPFRVDLRVTPGSAREFDLWRSGMDPLFKLDAPDAEARASFGANLTAYQFADLAIISGRSSAATFQRTWPLIARSGLDFISLLVYAEGGCALDVRGGLPTSARATCASSTSQDPSTCGRRTTKA
jgi:hypothetical protein